MRYRDHDAKRRDQQYTTRLAWLCAGIHEDTSPDPPGPVDANQVIPGAQVTVRDVTSWLTVDTRDGEWFTAHPYCGEPVRFSVNDVGEVME